MITVDTHQAKALAQKALYANRAHQSAIVNYAERLTAELQELEKLVDAVNADDADDEPDTEVQIPGAIKPASPFPTSELLNPESPFFEEAFRRTTYLSNTADRPMKAKELRVLADAVKCENMRLQAYQSQKRGQDDDLMIDIENNVEGLDWTIIAEKVSGVSGVKRDATQCRIKWLGGVHPRINHKAWSNHELKNLKDFVSEQLETNDGRVDWVLVAERLGTNRTPIDCMSHGISRPRHTWNEEFDKKLYDGVQLYGIDNWGIVATYVSQDVTAAQCQGRYFRALDPSLKRGSWSKDEFSRLAAAVAAYENSWVEVAACIPGRTNEQCRERWTEHISLSSAQTEWSEGDDEALLNAVETIGNQWKVISAKIANGTTGAQCRRRYEKLRRRRAAASTAIHPSPMSNSSVCQVDSATPQPCEQDTAASSPMNNEIKAHSIPAARRKPRPSYKGKGTGKEKEFDTIFDRSTRNASSDAPGREDLIHVAPQT